MFDSPRCNHPQAVGPKHMLPDSANSVPRCWRNFPQQVGGRYTNLCSSGTGCSAEQRAFCQAAGKLCNPVQAGGTPSVFTGKVCNVPICTVVWLARAHVRPGAGPLIGTCCLWHALLCTSSKQVFRTHGCLYQQVRGLPLAAAGNTVWGRHLMLTNCSKGVPCHRPLQCCCATSSKRPRPCSKHFAPQC